MGKEDAPGQIKKNQGHASSPPPPPDPTPGAGVTLRREGGFLYADSSGFTPGPQHVDFQSHPVDGNPSNTGVGVGLYTTDDDGNVSFPVAEQYIIPDFPRTVTAKVWDEDNPANMATTTETYTS